MLDMLLCSSPKVAVNALQTLCASELRNTLSVSWVQKTRQDTKFAVLAQIALTLFPLDAPCPDFYIYLGHDNSDKQVSWAGRSVHVFFTDRRDKVTGRRTFLLPYSPIGSKTAEAVTASLEVIVQQLGDVANKLHELRTGSGVNATNVVWSRVRGHVSDHANDAVCTGRFILERVNKARASLKLAHLAPEDFSFAGCYHHKFDNMISYKDVFAPALRAAYEKANVSAPGGFNMTSPEADRDNLKAKRDANKEGHTLKESEEDLENRSFADLAHSVSMLLSPNQHWGGQARNKMEQLLREKYPGESIQLTCNPQSARYFKTLENIARMLVLAPYAARIFDEFGIGGTWSRALVKPLRDPLMLLEGAGITIISCHLGAVTILLKGLEDPEERLKSIQSLRAFLLKLSEKSAVEMRTLLDGTAEPLGKGLVWKPAASKVAVSVIEQHAGAGPRRTWLEEFIAESAALMRKRLDEFLAKDTGVRGLDRPYDNDAIESGFGILTHLFSFLTTEANFDVVGAMIAAKYNGCFAFLRRLESSDPSLWRFLEDHWKAARGVVPQTTRNESRDLFDTKKMREATREEQYSQRVLDAKQYVFDAGLVNANGSQLNGILTSDFKHINLDADINCIPWYELRKWALERGFVKSYDTKERKLGRNGILGILNRVPWKDFWEQYMHVDTVEAAVDKYYKAKKGEKHGMIFFIEDLIRYWNAAKVVIEGELIVIGCQRETITRKALDAKRKGEKGGGGPAKKAKLT